MKYKIYTLEHPISKEIRYIGFTSMALNIRLNSHIYEARNTRINTKNSCWIKSLLKKGLKPKIELLDEFNDNWQFWEQYWISQFKAWGFKLTNLTIGGEGNIGYKPTEKVLSKIRKVYCKYDVNGKFIKKYKSITEAAKDNNTSIGCINQAAKTLGFSKGYQWRYYSKGYRKNIGKCETMLRDVKIYQYSLNGDFIKEWSSIGEIVKILNIKGANINKVLKGIRDTAGNYQWRYFFDKRKVRVISINSGFKKEIIQLDIKNTFITKFNSLSEAEKLTGISNKNISNVLRGKSKTAGGFKWKYKK